MILDSLAEVDVVAYSSGRRFDWHSHDRPVVVLMLAGFAREGVGSHDLVLRPLEIGFKPAGIRHTDHMWDSGVRALRILGGEGLTQEWRSAPSLLERWGSIRAPSAIPSLMRLASLVKHPSPDVARAQDLLMEGLAATTDCSRACASPPAWLRRIREAVLDEWDAGITLGKLAAREGVHRVYLARAYRRHFGCSVGEHVRQLQLEKSVRLLSQRHGSLGDIALRCKFSDQAHFTRVLSRHLGMAPGKYRALVS